jgi:hypothetical protein
MVYYFQFRKLQGSISWFNTTLLYNGRSVFVSDVIVGHGCVFIRKF